MPNEPDDNPLRIRSAILASLVDETLEANRAASADAPPIINTPRLHDPEATTQPTVARIVDPNAITEDVPVTRRSTT